MNILRPSDHERAVIGILAGGVAQDMASVRMLSPEDFSDRAAGRIFAACRALMDQHKDVSFQGLDEILTRECGADQGGDLMQIVMAASSQYKLNGWQLPEAVRIVREASQRRALVRIGEAIARGAADEQRDMPELIDKARNALRESVTGSAHVIDAQTAILNAYEAAERAEKPIPTGIRDLDARVLQGGLHRGELTVLGARPGVGKSAVMSQMAVEAAKAGNRVVFVSLEMSSEQIGARLIGRFAGENISLLRGGSSPNEKQWVILAEAANEAGNVIGDRLKLIARGNMTVEELTSEVIGLHDSGDCDLLVVDYLQLLRTRQKTGNDFERLGIVSRGLKAITLDLGIPVLTAAQVRRQNNGGVARAPGLDELRGSGDIEQDADNVILLHSPEAADDSALYRAEDVMLWNRAGDAGKRMLMFNVAKQRQGITACAWAVFDPSRMRFESPEDFTGKGVE